MKFAKAIGSSLFVIAALAMTSSHAQASTTGSTPISVSQTQLADVSWPPPGVAVSDVSWPPPGVESSDVSWPPPGVTLSDVSWPPPGTGDVSWPPPGVA